MSLFPEKMNRICLLVHRSDLENVIDNLSEEGVIHIAETSLEKETHKDTDVDVEISKLTPYENRLRKVISILRPFYKRRSGLKALLNPPDIKKIKVRKKDLHELIEETEKNLQEIEGVVLDTDARMKSLDEKIKANEILISKLSNLQFLNVDLEYLKKSKHIFLKAGISREVDLLKEKVESLGGIFDYRFLGKREKKWVVVGVFHSSAREEVERVWQRYTEEIELPDLPGTPSEIIERLKRENRQIEKEVKKLKQQLMRIARKDIIKLLANLEELSIEKLKLDARKKFGRTDQIYVIEGWVLDEDVRRLLKVVERSTNGRFAYTISNPSGNPEEPPTYIRTGRVTGPFKPLLALFGLPKYREINPLLFLTLWFPMLFGFMLGDAGYGLVISLGSAFAYLKFGKRSGFVRNWSVIGMLLGLWTIVFGYLSNSFFGDLLERFFHTHLPQINIMGVEIPVDGLKNPLVFLQIALILGIIHLNIGLFLGIYQDLKNRRIKSLVCSKVSFILLQIFGGALIGEYLLKIWTVSGTLKTISYVGVLIGIVLLAVEAKGMAFLEVMGFVGDWLSYARLLALGLATAGMALAFNIVAQLFGDMIHVTVSVIILILAHFATMGLNSLGAAVHSLRLQYVEFFNRFYEGGGKEFRPLKAKRKYTELV